MAARELPTKIGSIAAAAHSSCVREHGPHRDFAVGDEPDGRGIGVEDAEKLLETRHDPSLGRARIVPRGPGAGPSSGHSEVDSNILTEAIRAQARESRSHLVGTR